MNKEFWMDLAEKAEASVEKCAAREREMRQQAAISGMRWPRIAADSWHSLMTSAMKQLRDYTEEVSKR